MYMLDLRAVYAALLYMLELICVQLGNYEVHRLSVLIQSSEQLFTYETK
jgi:hypothetical protein